MTPEQRKNYEQVNNVVEKYLADGVDMDLCQIRYYALKELCDTIREQESELKAGAGMLAKMHDKNLDLEAEIERITQNAIRILTEGEEAKEHRSLEQEIVALKARLKPVEEIYTAMKTLLYDKRGFIVDDKTEDIKIPEAVWNAIKSASNKEQPDETKK